MLLRDNYMEGSFKNNTFSWRCVHQMLSCWALFNTLLMTRARKEGTEATCALRKLNNKQNACLCETREFIDKIKCTLEVGISHFSCLATLLPVDVGVGVGACVCVHGYSWVCMLGHSAKAQQSTVLRAGQLVDNSFCSQCITWLESLNLWDSSKTPNIAL